MTYEQRAESFSALIKKADRKYNHVSLLRLFAAIAAGFGITLVFYFDMSMPGWILFTSGLIAFIILVFIHHHVAEQRQYLQLMYNINMQSHARVTGEWVHFTDSGEEYVDIDHPYSRDLDIFGPGSLFQLINTTNTPRGRELLKSTLEKPYQTYQKIIAMQEAVTELAEKIDWRQTFQAEGMRFSKKTETSASRAPLNMHDTIFKHKAFIFVVRMSPVLLISSIITASLIDSFPAAIPACIAALQMLIIAFFARRTHAAVLSLLSFREMIKKFNGMIKSIEQETFSSQHCRDIKSSLLNTQGKSASSQTQRLETLTDIISMRASIIHFPVNILIMIDLQCIISFEKWYHESGVLFDQWIDAIAAMETAASLAIVRCDNPSWCMPVINNDPESFVVSATDMAHPLIDAKSAVTNTYTLNGKGHIDIITGSNMSGKSTFLRTVALNCVLAYMGAPVCAQRMECSLMKIYTSMRIIDNIGKHVSSFYAELLRIKMIIDESANKEKIFFALDEIFRGTNSRDRILGARAVIKNLSKENVIGMISTHDLELTELSRDDGSRISNFHFRESYVRETHVSETHVSETHGSDDILFDYKLYDGVSTTSDALYLMKKAGIEV